MSVKPLYEGVKLTKKFYMGLPDRVFLVCSVGMSPDGARVRRIRSRVE